MTNLMHKFLNLFYLSIYFCLTCFGLSFSPSLEAGVQLRQWFKSPGYGVSTRARMELTVNLKTCTLSWSLYNFRLCTYNVTLWRVRVTIIAVEKQQRLPFALLRNTAIKNASIAILCHRQK
jgi:hypothetical protein